MQPLDCFFYDWRRFLCVYVVNYAQVFSMVERDTDDYGKRQEWQFRHRKSLTITTGENTRLVRFEKPIFSEQLLRELSARIRVSRIADIEKPSNEAFYIRLYDNWSLWPNACA
jgi:hypothetical protein